MSLENALIQAGLSKAEIVAGIGPIVAEAREIFERILAVEAGLRLKRDELLLLAFRLGSKLALIKDAVGHGRWLFWLGANWPDLGERNAQRCLALYRENDPKSVESTDLTAESIRKFLWGYIPAKERKELEGDQPISRKPHPLTFVNSFFKWDQRIKAGLDSAPPDPVLRRDLEPVLRRIIELTGREWVGSLLGT